MRSLTTRAKPFAQQLLRSRSIVSSVSFINHDDSKYLQHSDEKFGSFLQCRSYGVYGNSNNNNTMLGLGFGVNFQDPKRSACRCCDVPMTTASGFLLARNMSSTNKGYGSEKIHDIAVDKTNSTMTDHIGDNSFFETSKTMSDTAADTFVGQTVEFVSNQTPVINEVVAAAADSFLPVAAMQYAFYGIHIFTGFNWWACIAMTPFLVKTLLLPLTIKQKRATAEYYIKKLEIEEAKKKLQNQGKSLKEVEEIVNSQYGNFRFRSYFYWNKLFISVSIFVSSIFAIRNMVKNVPSFTTGGLAWFLDLTTRDTLFILPCLLAFSGWMEFKLNPPQGLEGSRLIQRIVDIQSALMVLVFAGVSKAILCYLISELLSGLFYQLILENPKVKKLLKIPHIEH